MLDTRRLPLFDNQWLEEVKQTVGRSKDKIQSLQNNGVMTPEQAKAKQKEVEALEEVAERESKKLNKQKEDLQKAEEKGNTDKAEKLKEKIVQTENKIKAVKKTLGDIFEKLGGEEQQTAESEKPKETPYFVEVNGRTEQYKHHDKMYFVRQKKDAKLTLGSTIDSLAFSKPIWKIGDKTLGEG